MSDAADEAQRLRAELEAQRAVLARLEVRLDHLDHLSHLDHLDGSGSSAPSPVSKPSDSTLSDSRLSDSPSSVSPSSALWHGGGGATGEPIESGPDAVTDRRRLLSRAATAAAGAVAGGTAMALGQASPAAAAAGTFDGDPAVTATAAPTSGVGVSATSSSGTAVSGTSTSGVGVQGNSGAVGFGVKGVASSGGTGVQGQSQSGYALKGIAESGIGAAGTSLQGTGLFGFSSTGTGLDIGSTSGRAIVDYVDTEGTHLQLDGTPIAPPSSTVARNAGSIVRDVGGDLWYCVGTGTPGTWRKLSGVDTAGALHVLPTPVRVYDSRPNDPPAIGVKSPLVPATARTCDLKANGSGVPAGATAVLVSLTVTGTTGAGGGFLAVYRNGIAWPGTSNLNWSAPNQNVAVTTVTAVDANAICNLYASQATNVIVDVLGYYR